MIKELHEPLSKNSSADIVHQNNVAQDIRVIFEKNDYRGRITIFESPDKLSAWMRIVPERNSDRFYLDDILFILNNLGIVTGVKEQELETALAELGSQNNVLPDLILIAEGRPAIAGSDGQCEFLFDQVDPYVEKGQKILRITEPTEGMPGENIYGEIINPLPGTMPTVIPGDHVIENELHEFESEIFGKVNFENNVLTVEKVLHIKISADAMEATLTYTGTKKLTHNKIKEELYAHNIVSGIDDRAIDTLIKLFNEQNIPVTDVVVARGTPRKEGRDAEIKYHFHQTKGLSLNEYMEDGVIIRGTNVIKSVQKGQEIASITPHIDPINGKDIYGRILPARKVKKARLRAGKNVTISDDGLHFFSETGGRPIVEGDKISVHDVLTISGDVDYTVGNIDFDGIVEITGDVFDGFNVKASKSIIIGGVVGSSTLEAGLDILIQGGCKGLNKAKIICGGNIEAKYIHEFYVEARGNILVKNEIVSSTIMCLGRIFVKYGSIRGGILSAKKGIESLDIGNEIGIKTTLIPGDDFEINAECKKIEEDILKKHEELESLSKRVAPFVANKELIAKLPPDAQEKLKKTIYYMKTIQQEKVELLNRKNKLLEQSLQDATPEVVVMHYIHHGVVLKIGTSRRVISSLLEGPLRLYQENDRITVEPYSSKHKKKIP